MVAGPLPEDLTIYHGVKQERNTEAPTSSCITLEFLVVTTSNEASDPGVRVSTCVAVFLSPLALRRTYVDGAVLLTGIQLA
jgi:hypothetical protein